MKHIWKPALCLMLLVCLVALGEAAPALAEGTGTQADPYVLDSTTATWKNAWYIANADTTITSRVKVSGSVHLILCNGAELNIPKGITVTGKNSLTIYGQSGNTGRLTINNVDSGNAGIGGTQGASAGNITINGGEISVTGGGVSNNIGGGAGIGGGGGIHADSKESDGGSGGTVTINGGTVTANGGPGGAGIGGGGGYKSGTAKTKAGSGGNVTINGGTVTANGGKYGAGIGSGYEKTDSINGGTVTISGGTVAANGGKYGAGIGGGNRGDGGEVIISGGTVTAKGGEDGAGIGGGSNGNGAEVTVSGGIITAIGDRNGTGIGSAGNGTRGTLTVGFDSIDDCLIANSYACWASVAEDHIVGVEDTAYDNDLPVHDLWGKKLEKYAPRHTLTLAPSAGGTAAAFSGGAAVESGGKVREGAAVTLTLSPDASCALTENGLTVTYTDGDGHIQPVSLTAGAEPNQYVFTMPEYDVTVTAAFTQTAPVFTSAALELGSVLNLRYYVSYPSEWDTTGDKVVFTVNGVSRTVAYDANRKDNGVIYFPCPVNAYQMADRIDAVYYHGEQEVARKENYTVKENLNYLNIAYTGATQTLVQATMNYGTTSSRTWPVIRTTIGR